MWVIDEAPELLKLKDIFSKRNGSEYCIEHTPLHPLQMESNNWINW